MEKLVRRHVPDHLRARGEKVETRIAEPHEMLGLLRDKLVEEVQELVEAIDAGAEGQIIEELADVHEVIDAFTGPHLTVSSGPERGLWIGHEARARQFDKATEKGDFTNIVMMLDVPEPMILHCPKCGVQHVDRGIWGTTRVHRTHCAGCGELWKPFDYATVGVEDVAVFKLAGSGAAIGTGATDPAVHVGLLEIQAWLRERADKLKVDVKIELFAFFDRLRKTITLNRGQSAEVLANSILAHLDLESQE
jgi:predicted house-cleaning noncanonical NTP pyrophosphatase (MazG superfamily)